MKILVVGVTYDWKQRVFATLPDDADVTIKGDLLATLFAQEERSYDLYIFGNRVREEHNVAVQLLEEAVHVGDKTPTIVFSEEFDKSAEIKIAELGGILIRSDTIDADTRLADAVLTHLTLERAH